MKTAWNILAIVAVLNLLVLLGFVAWLHQSHRLNRARYDAIVALLSSTVQQETDAMEEQRKKEDQQRAEQEKVAHLRQVGQGPVTLFDRLAADQQADELAMHKLARLQTEIADLHRGLEAQNRQLAMERQDLIADRKAFEDAVTTRQAQWNSEDFQRAVQTLEQVKPAQARQMMEDLLRLGREGQVVDYLAAMDLRKSAAVMREFKTPEQITVATRLIEQLRLRRSQTAAGGASGSNG